MFAGVLDGGQNEVFLGGTRLKQFMESVEKAPVRFRRRCRSRLSLQQARRANRKMGLMRAMGLMGPMRSKDRMTSPSHPSVPATSDWSGLLAAGASFLDQLSKTIGAAQPRAGGGLPTGLIAQDQHTGQPYLKLPLPDEGTMRKIADLLSVFTGGR